MMDRRRLGFRIAALALLIVVAAGCNSCLWLAIPSLAYQGYKYESGDQNGQAKQHQNSQPAASTDNVE